METLTVTNVENLQDKNGKPYNKIELSTPAHKVRNGVKIRIEPKTQNIVKYPKSYLPGEDPQYGHDFKQGEVVAGDIVTRGNLMPYNIIDPDGTVTRQATSASHVVLGDSDDADAFEAAVQREFRSRGKFPNDGSEESIQGYIKFWGFAPDTGEVVEDEAEAETTATL